MMIKIVLLLGLIAASKGNKPKDLKSTISYEDDTIRLHCVDEDVTLDNLDQFEAFKETKSAKTIVIDTCGPPSHKSYADLLKTLNVNVGDVKVMHILNPPRTEDHFNARNEDRPDPKRPKKEHFTGLELEELQILNDNFPAAFAIELSFLEDLNKLTKLVLHNMDTFGPFPNTSKLETVEIAGGVFYGDLGPCPFKVIHLAALKMFGEKDEYSYGRLKDCKQLVELKLEYMDRQTCKVSLLRRLSRTLRNVTIRHSHLDDFPGSYALFPEDYSTTDVYDEEVDNYLLTHLDLSYNNLQSTSFLSTHRALKTVDLSHNDILYGMFYQPNVTDLKLDHNNYENYCDTKSYTRIRPENEFLRKIPLKRLSVTNAGMRELCFDSMPLPALELLNLTNNNIAVLDYRQLYNVSDHQIEVDLRNNPLERVAFTRDDYEALKRNDSSVSNWRNIKLVTHARFTCNCSHAWLGRALRENLLTIEGATCTDGSPLDVPRLSYALEGCAEACAGADGCSAASTIHKIRENRDKITSIFSDQNSLWWAANKIYDKIVGN